MLPRESEPQRGVECRLDTTSSSRYAVDDTFIELVHFPHHPEPSLCSRIGAFLRRIDVSWTIVYFFFLAIVSTITTMISRTLVIKALSTTWRDVHHVQPEYLFQRMNLETGKVYSMAQEFISLHANAFVPYASEAALSTLCSVLVAFDQSRLCNTFTVASAALLESSSCAHALDPETQLESLLGYVSVNHTVDASYYIDKETYKFIRPLQVAVDWTGPASNISNVINYVTATVPIFDYMPTFLTSPEVAMDWRKAWMPSRHVPHLISFNVPFGVALKGLPQTLASSVLDYIQIRINATRLLHNTLDTQPSGLHMVTFINSSLSTSYPRVMSTNWGQQTVFNASFYTPFTTLPVDYLNVSDMDSPLMLEAVKHFNLADLQSSGYNRTVSFWFKGATAFATAETYTTEHGLTIPILYASAQNYVTGPYRIVMNVSVGALTISTVLFTAIFWFFVHSTFAVPLRQMTALLLASVETGKRLLYHPTRHGGVILTEVRNLADAHNDMMQRLQDIDDFIPESVRRAAAAMQHHNQNQQPEDEAAMTALADIVDSGAVEMCERPPAALVSVVASVVYVTVRAVGGEVTGTRPRLAAVTAADVAGRPPHLVEVVESAAHAIGAVNCGPFALPAALRAFVSAVRDLSQQRRGVVHQLTPDRCTVHFATATLAHARSSTAAPEPREAECCARSDARDAVGFALALQQWVDDYARGTAAADAAAEAGAEACDMPDVFVLVDTSVFACGQYRPRGSEQTLSVALGRDVQRDVGHVPAAIGVRVAMTADTACRVRAKRNAPAGSSGTRQLPVEALRTGRAGLDANLIILFEALPGSVAGDAAWRRYAHLCFDAFARMLRGDYTGALRSYRGVADIADLEPGLMPRSLSREAARSTAVGGAVSTQVERLMKECQRRIARSDTRPFCRERHVPLGIDAVLQQTHRRQPTPHAREKMAALTPTSRPVKPSWKLDRWRSSVDLSSVTESSGRYVVEIGSATPPCRTVVTDANLSLLDNHGQTWRMASTLTRFTHVGLWRSRISALGTAGALATTNFLPFVNVPAQVSAELAHAPLGFMSEELSSRVPPTRLTEQQKTTIHNFFHRNRLLRHPSLLAPNAYSLSAEGGVFFIWEYNSGGSLRQILNRYSAINPVTVMRFAWHITSALAYLHQRGLYHGTLCPENVMVSTDGRCRLLGYAENYAAMSKHFPMTRTTYASPSRAAGAAPTAACDMHAFGLIAVELLTHGKVWKWGPHAATEVPPSQQELCELVSQPSPAFFAAVVEGRIVPDMDILDGPLMTFNERRRKLGDLIRRCLSANPSERPAALEYHCELTRVLQLNGFNVEGYA